LSYTTNRVEGYHRQLRKLLYLAVMNITKKWTRPIQNWARILNRLAFRFAERVPV